MPLQKFLAVAAALLVAAAPATSAADSGNTAASVRLQTFETVWTRVNEKFYDPEFNGVDWGAVRERYRPRVEALTSDAELYPLLTEMLGELKASHFSIQPPEEDEVRPDPKDDPTLGGIAGMTVRLISGRPIIAAVEADGPAAKAGLRPGLEVTRIGAHVLDRVIERARTRTDRPVRQAHLVRHAADRALGGMVGSTVEIAYRDEQNRPRTASVVRAEARGKLCQFGNMPLMLGRVETRRLESGIGYLRFNIFMPQLLEDIRAAIASFQDAPGLIIDLRGNPGGVGVMAPAIAAALSESHASLGIMKMRTGVVRFLVYPQGRAYLGPVAVLIDESSASTSEILAGGLQESGRAVVVGSPSLGAVLPSVIEKLPNGAVFQYAVADFRTPKGVLLEGRGVTPDLLVAPSVTEYRSGRDPVIEAASRRLLAARPAEARPTR